MKPGLQVQLETSNNPEAERKAAEWVCANRGSVQLKSGNMTFNVVLGAALPNMPFEVTGIGPGGALSGFTISDEDVDLLLPLKSLGSLEPKRVTLTDEGLKKLATAGFAPRVWTLKIDSPKITDAGLEHLKGFPALTALWLNGTAVTDDGLKHIAELKKLLYVNLKGTKVTTPGVKKLILALPANCKVESDYDPLADADRKLAEWVIGAGGTVFFAGNAAQIKDKKSIPAGPLSVSSTILSVVVDADVARFRDADGLTLVLGLPENPNANQLTDKGLAEWATLPHAAKLQMFFLHAPKVTDAGIVHLGKFTSLQLLDLSGCGITDEGLKTLAMMKTLGSIDLRRTKVTAEGVKELKAALPKCTIYSHFEKK